MKNIIKNSFAAVTVSVLTVIALGVYGILTEEKDEVKSDGEFKMFDLKKAN
mgnify:CR=1 FL=1